MDVWLSTIGQRLDHADNTRTMLLARFLIEAGHTVTLWTSAYDHIRKEWRREWIASAGGPLTMPDGLAVRFMKGCGYRRNIGLRRLLDHLLAARDFRAQAKLLPAPDIVVASLPFDKMSQWSLANNVQAWVSNGVEVYDESICSAAAASSDGGCSPTYILGAAHGALYLGILLAVAVVLSLPAFQRRDVN